MSPNIETTMWDDEEYAGPCHQDQAVKDTPLFPSLRHV
jgi:hypothetical protein